MEDIQPVAIRVYKLVLRLPLGQIEHKEITRYQGDSADLFNALCAAIARESNAKIIDVIEVT